MKPSPRPYDPAHSPQSGSFVDAIKDYGARLGLLSGREHAVMDLAAEGLTDEQIAQSLGLSVSTVNSYWVRVRGKIGPLSRTEIVAGLLRHQARLEHAALRAENASLLERLRQATERSHELHAAFNALRDDPWPLTALACLPDATLVTGPPATVVYANDAARRLYLAEPGELESLPMRDLTAAATPEALREPCREMFEEGGPAEERIGVEEPYYVRRRDGTNFRAVVHARRFASRTGPLAVVTVREFLGDVDAMIEALRQPLRAA